MELVDPPRKPDNVVADAVIEATHPDKEGKGCTYVWIGHPYQNANGQWFCESHVEGFPQPKVPGSSSLEALTGAILAARLHLEGFIALGYELHIPQLPDVLGKEKVFERLFGMYGWVHSSCLKK